MRFFNLNRNTIWGSFFILLIGGSLCFAIYLSAMKDSYPNEWVSIPSGWYASHISEKLSAQNVIRYPLLFRAYLKITGSEKTLRSGLFELNRSYSVRKIVRILQGKEGRQALIRVTIPEGLNIEEIAGLLEEKECVKKEEFIAFVRVSAKPILQIRFPFLAEVPTSNLEGYLFPDTYFFAIGVSKTAIVEAFISQFSKEAWGLWKESGGVPHFLSFHEWVTLASMIEREAANSDEMPIISGVFYNRLHNNIPLASDPTVTYALKDYRKKRVLYKDLEINSPYNTYRQKGLPPTPIASPGLAALKAALYPKRVPYYFFVSNEDGTHTFSVTYREHLRAQQHVLNQKKRAERILDPKDQNHGRYKKRNKIETYIQSI